MLLQQKIVPLQSEKRDPNLHVLFFAIVLMLDAWCVSFVMVKFVRLGKYYWQYFGVILLNVI